VCRIAPPDDRLLVCDKCDRGYHMDCLKKVTPGRGFLGRFLWV